MEKQQTENRTQTGHDRDSKGRFLPGNKHGGRPVMPAELRALAQARGGDAVRIILDLMDNASTEDIRLKAAQALLDRGYGKPTQPISGDSEMPPVQIMEIVLPAESEPDGN